ncbi:MAG: hypothetical protein LJE59_08620 [Chromatiaceae bacterium]|jgi:hypothetical protein|nr:hypothetical protein [Chromatiaceae bacterium]
MKIPLVILAIVALILVLSQVFLPKPGPDSVEPRTDLPWQIQVNPDGSSRVFDLQLGSATLADAMAKFGGLEDIAVFEPGTGPLVLEAYFGDVQFGPLKAKIVVGLEASDAELAALRERSVKREGSPSGDWKYVLADAPKLHAGRRLSVITYIPGARKLDADFFRARFGEPAASLQENEQAVSWFYPQYGLSILIDDQAREVLEYQPPRDFVMPQGVTANPAAP